MSKKRHCDEGTCEWNKDKVGQGHFCMCARNQCYDYEQNKCVSPEKVHASIWDGNKTDLAEDALETASQDALSSAPWLIMLGLYVGAIALGMWLNGKLNASTFSQPSAFKVPCLS